VLAEGTLIVPDSQGDVAARTSEAKKVVGRDGIEPPTPGFSDRAPAAGKYAEALHGRSLARRARWFSLVTVGRSRTVAGTERAHRCRDIAIFSVTRRSSLTGL